MSVRLQPASCLSREAARNPRPGQTQSGDSGEGQGLQSRPNSGAWPVRGRGGSPPTWEQGDASVGKREVFWR